MSEMADRRVRAAVTSLVVGIAILLAKTAAYLQDGPHRGLLLDLALVRSRHARVAFDRACFRRWRRDHR